MDTSLATGWWIAAGILVAAELATGTFYLLMLALGCVAGALGAHAGLASTAQLVTGAVVGAGATALWHWRRLRMPQSAPSQSNRDVNLDIGQTVKVESWADDGTARVSYRGAAWSVKYVGEASPQPGPHVIVGVEGSQLQVAAQH
jgi:membrane protein implicated in regulation of membrane protease activity